MYISITPKCYFCKLFFNIFKDMERLFSTQHSIQQELPYDDIDSLITMCNIFSKANNVSVHIIDYAQNDFLYVSPHPLFLAGYTQQEVKEMGNHFCEKILSPEDFEMLLEVNKMVFDYFYTLPIEERASMYIASNFYLHHKNGGKTLIHHKLVPVRFTPEGKLWMSAGFITPSPYKESGHVILTTFKKKEYYRYNFDRHTFVKYTPPKLSEREFEILNLTMRGYEEPHIAELLHISPYTIKSHRRKIIKKMGVNNLSNAVSMFHSQFYH